MLFPITSNYIYTPYWKNPTKKKSHLFHFKNNSISQTKMWMMGYNDCGSEFNDCGRKLRPLVPRPTMANLNNNNNNINPSASNPSFFSLNHHLATMENKRELINTAAAAAAPVVVSSRWNPTPEQLRTLEELYRRGTRTPSAEQIQHITAQLRRYGKIEGKNVFYWFQNHKARERQKRRRQMELVPSSDNHYPNSNIDQILERKDSGTNRTSYEIEQQTKDNWTPPSTNCSKLAEESVSIQKAVAAGVAVAAAEGGSRPDGWTQLDEVELTQRHNTIRNNNFIERNATWQMMTSSPFPPPTTYTAMAAAAAKARTLFESHKMLKAHDLNIFIMSTNEENNHHDQTLELFPLRSDGNGVKETEITVSSSIHHHDENFTTPYQFFEFLPIKN